MRRDYETIASKLRLPWQLAKEKVEEVSRKIRVFRTVQFMSHIDPKATPRTGCPDNPGRLTTTPQSPTISAMDRTEAVQTIAQKLGEVDREPLKKLKAVVKILGPDKALALCEKALAVEQQGGMMTRDGTRRRTPGGVFFYLVRGSNNKKVKKLWPQRKPESATPDTPLASQEG
jgi:hypothetical protein